MLRDIFTSDFHRRWANRGHTWLAKTLVGKRYSSFFWIANFYSRFTWDFSQIATTFTSLLKTRRVDFLVTDPVSINKDDTNDKFGSRKIVRAKVDTKTTKCKNKNKNKNLIKFFLANFQSFV